MSPPIWMPTALHELGVEEVPGPSDNPRIVEYHKAVDGEPSPDAVPWCSSFVNWVMAQRLLPRTHSRAARSWLLWGNLLVKPEYGAVTILQRGTNPAQGHVAFWIDGDDVMCWLLGGNQGDAVSIKPFLMRNVLGWRWPVGL